MPCTQSWIVPQRKRPIWVFCAITARIEPSTVVEIEGTWSPSAMTPKEDDDRQLGGERPPCDPLVRFSTPAGLLQTASTQADELAPPTTAPESEQVAPLGAAMGFSAFLKKGVGVAQWAMAQWAVPLPSRPSGSVVSRHGSEIKRGQAEQTAFPSKQPQWPR